MGAIDTLLTILVIVVALLIVGAFVSVVGFAIYSLIKNMGNRKYVGWYENGTTQYEGEYKNRKLEGKFIWWWENGVKEEEKEYKDGKLEGKWSRWDKNGKKKEEREYKNGIRMATKYY